ncbi:hypothetical protein L3X38_003114 [Prunus dulcis]|uniref:Uncharacterized protein n=1 Tax=Prunus dulcis TaxID=3755 RepID=A0AAD4WV82_PRUDU|nr:hypothetical protein L3X38_003114 [Prunus dulcis]
MLALLKEPNANEAEAALASAKSLFDLLQPQIHEAKADQGSASFLWGETRVHEVVSGNEAEAEGEDGAEAEDEEEGEGNDEADGLEGGEGTEGQMPLHIYRITTDDESHCLGVVLIEECEDAHELHEKVLDVIFENGDLEEYDTPSIEEYTMLYLQLNGDNIYRRTEDEETELVGWKGVRIEDCNGNIEALDEIVKNYFLVHGDIDACTLIYYTKLRNGFDEGLSLEIEWDVFTHLVRGVVAFSEDPWSDWLDGDERYIDWKPKKEDGILVSMCRITIDGKGTPWRIFYLTQKSK